MSLVNNTFPFVVDNDRVKVDIDPDAKKITRLIYGIFDTHENRYAYIGKTGQTLARRISWYTCMINKAVNGKPVERQNLIHALAANLDRYYFTVVREACFDESLSCVEEEEIEEHKPTMNSNRGGGGGSSLLSPSIKQLPVAPPHFSSPITPKKNYRLTRIRGRVKSTITPNTNRLRNVIYRIRQISTGAVYIGQTAQLSKRISSHLSRVNAGANKGELHAAIAANPEDFDMGVIRSYPGPMNLDALESEIIEHAKSEGPVLNKRKGGGGSKSSSQESAKKKLKFVQ